MTQVEMRLKRIAILNEKLQQVYESVQIDNNQCFMIDNGKVCKIDDFGGNYNALVIEYAENLEKAKKGLFGEDGDLFYMDELGEVEMFNAMLKEIEDASV